MRAAGGAGNRERAAALSQDARDGRGGIANRVAERCGHAGALATRSATSKA